MKRLLLLRHAKAVQDGKDGAGDHTRELTGRGRRDAARMGAWLHEHGFMPDLMLCSTAARTRETWSSVAEELGGNADIQFMKQLYLAPVKTIFGAILAVDDAVQTLLIVGHNPGSEDIAMLLAQPAADKEERSRLETLTDKFPTAALAILEFEVREWIAVKPQSGKLAAFVRPKDID
jgi:phosphohistidine phosphatase